MASSALRVALRNESEFDASPPKPILVVDDELPVLLALRRGLRDEFSVETAVDGEQAIIALRERGPYAAVISDLRMPKQNGLAVLAAAKAIAPTTARIMLTGDCSRQTAVDAVNSIGLFRFLNKPYPIERLRDDLRRAVLEHEHALKQETAFGAAEEEAGVRTLLEHRNGSRPLLRRPTPLTDVAEQVKSGLMGFARQSGVSISMECSSDCVVMCDEALLSAAVLVFASDMMAHIAPEGRILLVFNGGLSIGWSVDIADFGELLWTRSAPRQALALAAANVVMAAHGGEVTRHARPKGHSVIRLSANYAGAIAAEKTSASNSV